MIDLTNMNGITSSETYEDGTMKACRIQGFNKISTPYGDLVPQFTEEFKQFQRRKKFRASLICHCNGTLKSVALEEQMDIQTPLGKYPAELVTFYEDGALNRVFPLNGQIDGYWSENDEGELAESYSFQLSVGLITTKLISLRFDSLGILKSLTFWPKTEVTMRTPLGDILCRNGLSLYSDGALKSTEPAKAIIIETPFGKVLAFDPNAMGIHADSGSLRFHQDGNLKAFTSLVNTFEVEDKEGNKKLIEPREIPSYISDDDTEVLPVQVTLDKDHVTFNNGERTTFTLDEIKVKIGMSKLSMSDCSDCSSCSSCG